MARTFQGMRVKFFKALFGANAQKHEDRADELRLDFEYRDAAYYYQQAIDALDPEAEDAEERLTKKLREVRRQAFAQLLEEATELIQQRAPELAHEKLEAARGFADEPEARRELNRREEELEDLYGAAPPPPPPAEPEEVTGTEDDLFELALSGFDPEDRERVMALGTPFRLAYEACQTEQWEDALEKLVALLETDPEEPILLEMAAMAAERLGKDDQALELLNRSQEASPFRPQCVLSLSALHRKAGRTAELRNLLTRAAASRSVGSNLTEDWVQIHLEYALALSEDGHHKEAASTILALTGVKVADRAALYFNLAGVLERGGRDDEAQAALQKAIEAAPGRAIYLERLADFLVRRQRDLEAALKMLIAANETETTGGASMLGGGAGRALASPNRGRYLYKIARIYFLKGDDLEAERIITTGLAVSRDPEVTRALEDLRDEMRSHQTTD